MSENDSPAGADHGDLMLGKQTGYVFEYQPGLLQGIRREPMRTLLGIPAENLPFTGVDQWNAYEFSWLSPSGMPQVAIVRFTIPADSSSMVESKSFKLYLNSFNQTRFDSAAQVTQTLVKDLTHLVGAAVQVRLESLDTTVWTDEASLQSTCLDSLDAAIEHYLPNPTLLACDTARGEVHESVHSHLLRSLCPVTGQPDWGSVFIRYQGAAIEHRSLLQYIVSFRNCQEFHEQCVERMYTEIKQSCRPSKLSVFAQYLRRGGLDINPFRSDCGAEPNLSLRLSRQ